ncbi:isocitrate/isopropylmalate family dehydrogenase [Symbiobacterium thermophilum]|uniref:isocitrate/isopropylmalate family dehydrogenase n=1 Tax=Symbiobacterium thermophilum TaxID=2734 RepID=UPI0023543733|nr:isocitrate/isopropylmalate family dehydrogenase [Symbiobacterium thermophilum]
MLDHLGRADLGKAVMDAVEDVLEEGRVRTPDLGGKRTTDEMTDAIIAKLSQRFK